MDFIKYLFKNLAKLLLGLILLLIGLFIITEFPLIALIIGIVLFYYDKYKREKFGKSIFKTKFISKNNNELNNIIHVVLKNKFKITKEQYSKYQASSFYSYLYSNNINKKEIDYSLESLIISNYKAYLQNQN